ASLQGARRQRTGQRPRSPAGPAERNQLAMKTLKYLFLAAMFVLAAVPARSAAVALVQQANVTVFADDRDGDERKAEKADTEESLYDAATEMLDDHQWRKAASAFDHVAQMGGTHADAALYWKAYAQNKMGQRAEALDTLGTLQKNYAKSRWVED